MKNQSEMTQRLFSGFVAGAILSGNLREVFGVSKATMDASGVMRVRFASGVTLSVRVEIEEDESCDDWRQREGIPD